MGREGGMSLAHQRILVWNALIQAVHEHYFMGTSLPAVIILPTLQPEQFLTLLLKLFPSNWAYAITLLRYYSLMLFDNQYLLNKLILIEMRWGVLYQAGLLACLCAGGEQNALLWPSCLQCTQLPTVWTAGCREHSCLYGTWLTT